MNLNEFLKQSLIVAEFDALPEKVFGTQTKTTQMLNRPENMSITEVIKLSMLTGVAPRMLVDDFKCGMANITVEQYYKLSSHEVPEA